MIHIISDIHGCYFTLQGLLEKVRSCDKEAQFVFVGDYVDRGLRSLEAVDLVIEEQNKGAYCLRGNHDDVIDWIVNDKQNTTDLSEFIQGVVNLSNVGAWWLVNGFVSTIISYGVKLDDGASLDRVLSLFIDKVPDRHKQFYRGLKVYWENDTHFACHAYLDPKKELPRKLSFLPDSLCIETLWTRFPINYIETGACVGVVSTPAGIDCPSPIWNKIGVFGHSPVQSYGAAAPIRHGNLRLIDTGAFMGEYLTAYCTERDSWLLQATDSRDLFGEKRT